MTLYKLRLFKVSLKVFILFNTSFYSNCREETRVKKGREEMEKRIKNKWSPQVSCKTLPCLKERKKKSYFKLEVASIVKCDLLEVNNLSCLQKYWLEFHPGISTVKVSTELFWISSRNLEKISTKGSFLKIFNFGSYPDSTYVFHFLFLFKIYAQGNTKTFKKSVLITE